MQTSTKSTKIIRPGELEAFTIDTFCAAHEISRATYYNLRKRGLGPDEMDIGGIKRISKESSKRWREKMENAENAA